MNKVEIVTHHEEFVNWLEQLNEVKEEKWFSPIQDEKWSLAAIVSHIMKWDQYSLKEIYSRLHNEAAFTPFPEFQPFNQAAENYAHEVVTQQELIDESVKTRKSVIAYIESLEDNEIEHSFTVGEHRFTLREYLEDFLGHDKHHRNQIEKA
ncbi:DinB family protein [Rossellomorea aquimaris]|uniref:DinB family protein n=1 Tax=Rossellomorea aquimaris TaxID=189382 RepID=UPI0007D05AF3|nr:DinB family protein [Rossellomorea aquimaris]